MQFVSLYPAYSGCSLQREKVLGDFPVSIPPPRLSLSLSCFPFTAACNFFCRSLALLVLYSWFPVCFSCIAAGVRRGFLPIDGGTIYRLCALVCHLVSWQRQIRSQTNRSTTCPFIHSRSGASRLRCTTCQAAVFLKEGGKSKWTASHKWNYWHVSFFFISHISAVFFLPPSLWARVHWASRRLQCLFGSGIILHVYDT